MYSARRTDESIEQEARAILATLGGEKNHLGIRDLLHSQLTVLYTRAQSMIAFVGVVVTVTGFSGRVIAGTSRAGQFFIISGLAGVLLGALFLATGVLRVAWLTRWFHLPLEEWLRMAIRERELRTVRLRQGSLLVLGGFILYCISIAIMLARPHEGGLPAL